MTRSLLMLTPFLPLAMAFAMVLYPLRRPIAMLMPWAPLPALLAALLLADGVELHLSGVLLDLELGLDEKRRYFLLLTAFLWSASGFYSRGYIAKDEKQHRYNAIFLATMAGNLGLIIALDVPGFYVFFSVMTLSSYILVVFDQTPRAYRAGRFYLVLAILGETALLVGFLRAVAAADSLLIVDIPPALAGEDGSVLTLLLLFFGFAIKTGQFPLHIWLPLAHPAAPTPASAVLSGTMIKAGLLGMILFLPVGQGTATEIAYLVTGIGLLTAFYGVACGLPQTDPKTVLAYSSLSQMGVLVGAIGAMLAEPAAGPMAMSSLVIYAVHHGLAKGALFLSVGLLQRTRTGLRAAFLLAALCAFAIAGTPFTGGALAKFLLKECFDALDTVPAAILVGSLSFSALATSLLMLRFLWIAYGEIEAGGSRERAGVLLWLPFIATAILSQVLPWAIAIATGGTTARLFSLYALWEAGWPVVLALLIVVGVVAMARRDWPQRLPHIPEGDWSALLPDLRTASLLYKFAYRRTSRVLRPPPGLVTATFVRIGNALERLDEALLHRGAGAAALVIVVLTLGIVLI